MDETSHSEFVSMYKTYIEVINPLIIEIEIRKGEFPISVLNELRSFTTHISRYIVNPTNENGKNSKELLKAESHLDRILLDTYKYLIITLNDICIDKFHKKTKKIDLTLINSGNFLPRYNELVKNATNALKLAKKTDSENSEKLNTTKLFADCLDKYLELENFISDSEQHIHWAKCRKVKISIFSVLLWFLSIIVSGIISILFLPNFFQSIINWTKSLFP